MEGILRRMSILGRGTCFFLALFLPAIYPQAGWSVDGGTDQVVPLPATGNCNACRGDSCSGCGTCCQPRWEDKKSKKATYGMKCEQECSRGLGAWCKTGTCCEPNTPCGRLFTKKKLLKTEEEKVEKILKYDLIPTPSCSTQTPAPKEQVAPPPTPEVLPTPLPKTAVASDPYGSMPLGLNGYCPVTLFEREAWAEGYAKWGVRHRGRTYLFAGLEQQQVFLKDPDRYAPVLSGDDPVAAADKGMAVEGRREYGISYRTRTYLFASAESLSKFSADPVRYATFIEEAEKTPQLLATKQYSKR